METAAFPVQIGLDRNHPMTETDIYKNKLHDDIGPNWKDLARELGYNQATIDAIENEKVNCNKECCIELLVRWLRREGRCATAGKLADALTSAGLKNLADDLIYGPSQCQCSCCQKARMESKSKCLVESNDPYNVNKCEQLIGEMSEQLNDKLASLTQEVYEMSKRIIELEDNLLRAKQKCRDTEEENLSLRAKIKELEDTRQLEQEVVDNTESSDTGKVPVVSPDTDDAAREIHIGKRLEELNQHLQTYVTSPLQVPEVKQDKLKTPVKLDLLTRLSESLQELYSETLIIVTETCKCSEDLKREFYDFAYHGLRAEHNELVHRVSDLESALPEMSVDEKKEFERLQGFQVNRQRQCQRLEKLWRGLFSPPERLPKAPWSLPTAANGKTSKKKLLRRTDPGTRPKRTKPRDQPIRRSEAFSASEDDNSELRLNTKLVKLSIFRKKDDENVSSSVPYSLMRDS